MNFFNLFLEVTCLKRTTFSLSQKWPLNTSSTAFYLLSGKNKFNTSLISFTNFDKTQKVGLIFQFKKKKKSKHLSPSRKENCWFLMCWILLSSIFLVKQLLILYKFSLRLLIQLGILFLVLLAIAEKIWINQRFECLVIFFSFNKKNQTQQITKHSNLWLIQIFGKEGFRYIFFL